MERLHVGGEIYQATYILYQVKGEHPGMINKLNEILARPPAEVRVHNVNKGILHEYGLDSFIQIKHDHKYYVYTGTIAKMSVWVYFQSNFLLTKLLFSNEVSICDKYTVALQILGDSCSP